jgi:hypothetical protein
MGAAARHPPAYYLAAAAILNTARSLEMDNAEQMVRTISLALYMVFLLIGTQLLRAMLLHSPSAYYTSLVLLLFWPIGITMAGRITCDILLFTGQAGTLYALVKWLETKSPACLAAPFFWAGVAVMGKNSGVVMIGFAGAALLITAYGQRKNPALLIRKDIFLGIVFAAVNAAFSFWHGWIMHHIEAFGYYWDYLWKMAGSFNAFLFLYDANLGLSQDSFWNLWLHTLLLGSSAMPWKYPDLVIALKVLFCAMLFYGSEGILRARKVLSEHEKSSLLLLATFVVFMLSSELYLLLRTANVNYADARYAYPAVMAITLMYGIAMKHHQLAGRLGTYRAGALIGGAFAGTTILIFVLQFIA